MNEIFLDTETTGLSPNDKHKIVEIACIETSDLIVTKKIFHKIINPQRNVPDGAYKVHGFSTEFLKNKETFDKVVDEFLELGSFVEEHLGNLESEGLKVYKKKQGFGTSFGLDNISWCVMDKTEQTEISWLVKKQ